MIHYRFTKHELIFLKPAGTSRGTLLRKPSWIVHATDDNDNISGTGECSVIPGLSPDYKSEEHYTQILSRIEQGEEVDLSSYPSIRFGIESAQLDMANGGKQIYFNNDFSKGARKIPINGLVWMGTKDEMRSQIDEKIAAGFTTIKIKIGAIKFEDELDLLKHIRNSPSGKSLTIRVDANGAFAPEDAVQKLEKLAQYNIHSIEQPIKAGQFDTMRSLCTQSPIPIALDEELIGVNNVDDKALLLDAIRPQYIILKPSLHGGIQGTQEWIQLAEERGIAWWMTSALESNIGLNVICQLAGEYDNQLPQGLGTGGLYTNNLKSSLFVQNGTISLKNE